MFGMNDRNDQGNNSVGQPAGGYGMPMDSPMPSQPTTAQYNYQNPATASSQQTAAPAASQSADSGDDLLQIKQKALENLTPLVGHLEQLEQSAEEKFKTVMMLIQASDNPQMLPKAYDLANAIEDEKVRAQALLDVINEINYFTHKKESAGN